MKFYLMLFVFGLLWDLQRHQVTSDKCDENRGFKKCYHSSEVYRCFCLLGLEHITIGNGTNIRTVEINYTNVETFNKGLFPNVEHLVLSHSLLRIIPKEYFPPTLTLMDLSFNLIRVIDQQGFKGLSKLSQLNLSHNNLTHFSIKTFEGLNSLERLDLTGNQLATIDTALSSLSHLSVLKIANNQLPRIPKTGKELTTLQLGNNKILHLYSYDFISLTKLRNLDLQNNEIISIEEGTFDHNIELESIHLGSNKLNFVPQNLFSHLTQLKEMNMSNNKLHIAFADWFKYIRQNQYISCLHPGKLLFGNAWDCCDCKLYHFQIFLYNYTSAYKCDENMVKYDMKCNIPSSNRDIATFDMPNCKYEESVSNPVLCPMKNPQTQLMQHKPHVTIGFVLLAVVFIGLTLVAIKFLKFTFTKSDESYSGKTLENLQFLSDGEMNIHPEGGSLQGRLTLGGSFLSLPNFDTPPSSSMPSVEPPDPPNHSRFIGTPPISYQSEYTASVFTFPTDNYKQYPLRSSDSVHRETRPKLLNEKTVNRHVNHYTPMRQLK